MPLFSVIIPLYNKADTIERALKSVRAQTYRDFEVVVVDDGSTDNSAEIVERFQRIDHLRLIQQENAGVSAARNRGVREAMSEYVAFLDADDCWMPGHLAELARIVVRFPESVLVGTGFYWHVGGKVFKTRETGKIEKVDLLSEVALFQPLHTSSIAVRRREFLDLGGFDVHHGYFEDIELMFKLALKCPEQVILSRRALVCHLDDAEATITKDLPVKHRETPHLEFVNQLASDGNPPCSVRRFAWRFVVKTFSNHSFRLKTSANEELVVKYPGLVHWCKMGRVFAIPALRFFVWPIAVVFKGWYWLALRHALIRVK